MVVNAHHSGALTSSIDDCPITIDTPIKTIDTSINHIDTPINYIDTSINAIDTSIKTIDTPINHIDTSINCTETHPGSIETHPGSIETHPGSIETYRGSDATMLIFIVVSCTVIASRSTAQRDELYAPLQLKMWSQPIEYATMRRMLNSSAGSIDAFEVHSQSEAETIALGRRLGALLGAGDLVLLFAPFGAGKTHLTKGIAAAFGVDEAEVNSPSFVLINQYEAATGGGSRRRRMPIFHVDLYRVETSAELATVGLEDVLSEDSLAIIEWAERAVDWFPHEHLAISIAHTGANERMIRLEPHGAHYEQIVARLRYALIEHNAATR